MSCNDNKVQGESSKFIPSQFDIEGLAGPRRRFAEVVMLAKSVLKTGAVTKNLKVRYKPIIVRAAFIDSEHLVTEDTRKMFTRKGGWLIEGPDQQLFYVKEELFTKYFEIVEEEEVE